MAEETATSATNTVSRNHFTRIIKGIEKATSSALVFMALNMYTYVRTKFVVPASYKIWC